MEALISGSAGIALVMDGDQFASIHVDEPERTVPRDPAEYHYLIGEGKDFITVEDVTRDEVVRQLNLAYDSDDALMLVLILQDPELPEDIRRDAVTDLEELLEQGELGVFLEGVLYAHPLPTVLDLQGAMRFAREAGTRELLTLLELFWTHQDTIREVRAAWEAIPREQFSGEYDHWQATLVREGVFRDLVRQRASGKKVNDLFVEISSLPAVHALPNHRTILWQWIGSSLQNVGDSEIQGF